jgi:hypothetical protein
LSIPLELALAVALPEVGGGEVDADVALFALEARDAPGVELARHDEEAVLPVDVDIVDIVERHVRLPQLPQRVLELPVAVELEDIGRREVELLARPLGRIFRNKEVLHIDVVVGIDGDMAEHAEIERRLRGPSPCATGAFSPIKAGARRHGRAPGGASRYCR